jgi:hypothetical protein
MQKISRNKALLLIAVSLSNPPWNLTPSNLLPLCTGESGNKVAFGKTVYSSDSYKVIKRNLADVHGADICRQYVEVLAWQRLGHISVSAVLASITLHDISTHFRLYLMTLPVGQIALR